YERCPYHNDKGRIMADRQQIAPQPGTWEALPFLSTESEYRHQFVVWAFALIFVCLAGAVVIYPVWNVGYPWGSDSWGHLHRAEHMAQIIQSEGIVQGFFNSAWMADWYMGDPTRVYYPPLTNWVLGLLTVSVGDVFVAY